LVSLRYIDLLVFLKHHMSQPLTSMFVCLIVWWRSAILVQEKITDLSQITHKRLMLYTSSWSRFELTTSVVIYTDCIGSCKSNYPYNHGHSGPLLQCYFYMNPRTSYYLCTSFICNLCLVYYLHVLCRFIVYAIFVYNIVLFSGKTIVSFMDD
jgi:hypothetical protein